MPQPILTTQVGADSRIRVAASNVSKLVESEDIVLAVGERNRVRVQTARGSQWTTTGLQLEVSRILVRTQLVMLNPVVLVTTYLVVLVRLYTHIHTYFLYLQTHMYIYIFTHIHTQAFNLEAVKHVLDLGLKNTGPQTEGLQIRVLSRHVTKVVVVLASI